MKKTPWPVLIRGFVALIAYFAASPYLALQDLQAAAKAGNA